MGKENSSAAANVGENKNKRKPFYRKKGNGGGDNSNAAVTTKKIKEMKFYLHDSAARKSSESFGKIKESIILRIQKSFEEHIFLTESIISKTKKVFSKPERGKSTLAVTAANADERALENETFLEEYRIDYAIFRKDEKNIKRYG